MDKAGIEIPKTKEEAMSLLDDIREDFKKMEKKNK